MINCNFLTSNIFGSEGNVNKELAPNLEVEIPPSSNSFMAEIPIRLTIFAKFSILDIWLSYEYAYGIGKKLHKSLDQITF